VSVKIRGGGGGGAQEKKEKKSKAKQSKVCVPPYPCPGRALSLG